MNSLSTKWRHFKAVLIGSVVFLIVTVTAVLFISSFMRYFFGLTTEQMSQTFIGQLFTVLANLPGIFFGAYVAEKISPRSHCVNALAVGVFSILANIILWPFSNLPFWANALPMLLAIHLAKYGGRVANPGV